MMRTSPNPEGPWSDEIMAFTAMQPASGNVHDAQAHPEYDVNGGKTIYVTYSRSTSAPFSSEVRLASITLRAPDLAFWRHNTPGALVPSFATQPFL